MRQKMCQRLSRASKIIKNGGFQRPEINDFWCVANHLSAQTDGTHPK